MEAQAALAMPFDFSDCDILGGKKAVETRRDTLIPQQCAKPIDPVSLEPENKPEGLMSIYYGCADIW